MRIDISMSKDEHKFSVSSWWASSPEFVLHSLSAQLKAAAVIFPELEKYTIGTLAEGDAQTSGQGQKP